MKDLLILLLQDLGFSVALGFQRVRDSLRPLLKKFPVFTNEDGPRTPLKEVLKFIDISSKE